MIRELVEKNRSYRRFDQKAVIEKQTLIDMVDLTRLVASGANKQALQYVVACEPELNEKIYPTIGWAGYLSDWDGPVEGERPTGYIVLVQKKDFKVATTFDVGIAAQTILLRAVEQGLGGCLIGNLKREQLHDALQLPDTYEILLVIALGKPVETVVIDEMKNNDIKYWRDEKNIHHVPKRNLEDILL